MALSKKDVSLKDASIEQAAVMNERSVLLTFTNGSAVLVDSEELKKLALSSGNEIVDERDVDVDDVLS
jgi:hypothetical protein